MDECRISMLYGQGSCVPVVKAAVKVVKLVWQAGVVTDCNEGFYVQGDAW